jgi:preprotein translocase subunit SecY
MFTAFYNSIKIKDIRSRILFTAGIIVLVRVAANIPCPGINPQALNEYFTSLSQNAASGSFVDMFDLFSGGALQNFALATLGIMPYISASIIMQLMVPVVPTLEKISREGDAGRQKINQYTRYLTVLICIVQGAVAAMTMINPSRIGLPSPDSDLVFNKGILFIAMTVIVLTATTMIMMWLGEQITERGIGNGVSLIITINIIARMPDAIVQLWELAFHGGGLSGAMFKPVHLLILFIVFALVTAGTIMLTQGQRRVPVQIVRKGYGNAQAQAGTTYMPLKVNFAGVMPIIFAGAITQVFGMITPFLPWGLGTYFQYGSGTYIVIEGILILLFSFFWVANQFNPIQIADNLKKEGAYIPGVKPGVATADFLDTTMSKITFCGSIFLVALALFPMMLSSSFKVPFLIASFFGGTSLLIMVGVVLDTLTQLESHLTMRNYEGFLKKGKLRGRR